MNFNLNTVIQYVLEIWTIRWHPILYKNVSIIFYNKILYLWI